MADEGLTLEQLQQQGAKPAEGLTLEQMQGATPLKGIASQVKHKSKAFDKFVGKPLAYAHKHPFEAFADIAQGPQRALQAGELGKNPLSAMLSPKSEASLEAGLRQPMAPGEGLIPGIGQLRGLGSQIGQLEQGPLAGSDLPHKFARGVLDTGYDITNDPVSYLPLGLIAKGATKAIPALSKLGPIAERMIPGILRGEYGLEGWTEHGRATVESVINKTQQTQERVLHAAQPIIRKHADEILAGKAIPQDVRDLFKNPKNIPDAHKGLSPQDVEDALRKEQRALTKKAQTKQFQALGFIKVAAKKTPQTSRTGQALARSLLEKLGGKIPADAPPEIKALLRAAKPPRVTKAAQTTLAHPELYFKDPSKSEAALAGLKEFFSGIAHRAMFSQISFSV